MLDPEILKPFRPEVQDAIQDFTETLQTFEVGKRALSARLAHDLMQVLFALKPERLEERLTAALYPGLGAYQAQYDMLAALIDDTEKLV